MSSNFRPRVMSSKFIQKRTPIYLVTIRNYPIYERSSLVRHRYRMFQTIIRSSLRSKPSLIRVEIGHKISLVSDFPLYPRSLLQNTISNRSNFLGHLRQRTSGTIENNRRNEKKIPYRINTFVIYRTTVDDRKLTTVTDDPKLTFHFHRREDSPADGKDRKPRKDEKKKKSKDKDRKSKKTKKSKRSRYSGEEESDASVERSYRGREREKV